MLPTHRRRGILTAIKRRQLDDAAERGEAARDAVRLRRRYLPAVRLRHRHELDERHRGHAAFGVPPPGPRRTRPASSTRTQRGKLFPEIFDRARRIQPGAVQRVDEWWPDQFFWPEPDERGTRFYCVYESPEGRLDGYAAYRTEMRWDNGADGTVHVRDLVTLTPAARGVVALPARRRPHRERVGVGRPARRAPAVAAGRAAPHAGRTAGRELVAPGARRAGCARSPGLRRTGPGGVRGRRPLPTRRWRGGRFELDGGARTAPRRAA